MSHRKSKAKRSKLRHLTNAHKDMPTQAQAEKDAQAAVDAAKTQSDAAKAATDKAKSDWDAAIAMLVFPITQEQLNAAIAALKTAADASNKAYSDSLAAADATAKAQAQMDKALS